jgi:hypothetical protein
MQEASAIRKEEARRATEQKILQEMIQTEKEKAKQEQETDRIKALAEAEARALEQRELEEITRRTMLEKMKGEKEKWLAAINTTFSHVEGFNSLSISNIYEVNLPFLFILIECVRQSEKIIQAFLIVSFFNTCRSYGFRFNLTILLPFTDDPLPPLFSFILLCR